MKIHNDLLEAINSKKSCFLIGNGINRHNQKESEGDVSWERLLLDIYNTLSLKKKHFIPEGVTLPEFYDIIDLVKAGTVRISLQKEFANKLNWKPKNHHENIISKIKERESQILTTNFDSVLQETVKAKMYRYRVKGLRLLSDFYPWDSYFSDEEKEDPFNSFSIWHMQGQKNYHRSIKLGLNQYLLTGQMAKRYFPTVNQKENEKTYQTWLRLFFEKDLIIMGLGLQEQEIFIRWLLIQRARHFKNKPDLKKKCFYINHDKPNQKNVGKKFFMKSVGIKYVDFIDNYNAFYDDFWNDL